MKTSQVGFKKMNWLPKQSVWKEMQAAREKRSIMIKEFQERSLNLTNAFHSTFSYQITANVDNVAKTAADRIIAEGQKQLESKMEEVFGKLVDINA